MDGDPPRFIPSLGSQCPPRAHRRTKPPTDLYWAWKWLCTKLCPRGCWVPEGDLLALLLPSLPGCRDK